MDVFLVVGGGVFLRLDIKRYFEVDVWDNMIWGFWNRFVVYKSHIEVTVVWWIVVVMNKTFVGIHQIWKKCVWWLSSKTAIKHSLIEEDRESIWGNRLTLATRVGKLEGIVLVNWWAVHHCWWYVILKLVTFFLEVGYCAFPGFFSWGESIEDKCYETWCLGGNCNLYGLWTYKETHFWESADHLDCRLQIFSLLLTHPLHGPSI